MNYHRLYPEKNRLFILACITILFLLQASPSWARYDPALTWRTIQTDDFIIYYPEGHEQLAQRVLSLCPEVHRDITGYLGVEPRRCPIVLDPGTDVFNGYMATFPNRISLYETPLFTVRGFGPGSDLMDMVFTHEYTHYVHITTRLGWYGTLTQIIGDGFSIANVLSPGWVIEGVTTNCETLFTDGGRGRSALFRGEMMSFAEGQGLWSLNAAAVSSPYSPPAGRIYLAGYHMVEYMNRTYGADAFARLGRYQARHPLGATGESLESITGKGSDQFYQDFLSDFIAEARTTRERALSAGLPQGKVVLAEDLESFESHFWTEKGSIIGLRRGYDKKTALVEVDALSGAPISETETGMLMNLSARRLPDGRLVMPEVFCHPLGEGTIDSTDLVIFDPATKVHERLTKDAHIYSADLSPDGRTFVATRRNGMWIELVLMDADGTDIRDLVSRPGVYFDAPCWSPDGKWIAAVVKTGRNSDIVLVNPATGAMETLFASDVAEDNDPEFSPDGKWIVFSSDRSGTWNIHAWNLPEKRLYQLTSVPYEALHPHISKDGRTLSYANIVRGVRQVCTLDFSPLSGKPVQTVQGKTLADPDLKRLQPDVSFTPKEGIPLDAYKPFAHVPYFSSDEDGAQIGVLLMGADPVGINSYTLNLLYGFASGRPGYDINLTNKSFWPTWYARIYDTATEGNALENGKDYWYREQGGELSAGLSVIHQLVPSTVTASVRAGARLRFFRSLDDDVRVDPAHNMSVAPFGEITVSRVPDASPKDMVPSWGQNLTLSLEKGLSKMGGELPGYNTIASVTQHVPSFFTHQGLSLTLTHQAQKGQLTYSKDLSIPRGYDDDDTQGGLDLPRNLLMSAEYHFPILFMDDGIGLYAYHSDLLKGSLFADYGAGWDGGFDWEEWNRMARTSIGATLTNQCVLMAVLPIEFGIEAGYMTHEHDGFVNFIFRVEM